MHQATIVNFTGGVNQLLSKIYFTKLLTRCWNFLLICSSNYYANSIASDSVGG